MQDVILENIWPNWHIEALIEKGSFGAVYKARRTGVGFDHAFYSAVKVIRVPADDGEIRGLLADGMSREQVAAYYESALKGLVGEIELMESLKGSPNIVTIEDYEVRKNADGIGWTIYIRMELLKNLNQYRTEHPTTVDDVVRLGIHICSALEYCARKQIVHRDIKPDNIFVNEFGDFKLGDFGIARHLEMTAAHLSQKGTSNYMAPEIYRGEAYNGSVDIYSLGIVMYRLLNKGRLPFMPPYPKPISYEDSENAMSRRLNGEPLPEPATGGKLLADIVRRACSADVNFRYATAAQMKNDLYQWKNLGVRQATVPNVMNRGPAPSGPNFTYNNQGAGMPFDQALPGEQGRQSSYGSFGTPQMSGGPGMGQSAGGVKKKKSMALPITLGCILGVLVLGVVLFLTVPVNGYETLFDQMRYRMSDTDSRFNYAMDRGEQAYTEGDYEEALYFFEDRALAEKPRSLEGWIALMQVHTGNPASPEDVKWENLISDLEAVGRLDAQPDGSDSQDIINCVNACLDAQGEGLLQSINQGDTQNAQAQVTAFFQKYQQCTDAVAGKVDCGSDNARWYLSFFDTLSGISGCEEYAAQLLTEGYGKYPEDTQLADRQAQVDQAKLAMAYEGINDALSEGDFDTAYSLAGEMEETMDPEAYENLVGSIDYIQERTELLESLQSMLNAGDYDGVARRIREDAQGGIAACYLVDGVYTESVSEGSALLYDNNGLYYGEIRDNERYGSGFQLKYYSDGSYQLLDGNWDGNANGQCTYTWWSGDGTRAVVTGNFTDGYEDGTMSITWDQDGQTWTATYTSDMGTYTEIQKDESGASIYAIAYDSAGNSSWWSTTELSGNGCFIN